MAWFRTRPNCSTPANCPAPTTSPTPVTIDCDQLATHTFAAGRTVEVRPQANCTISSSIDINVSDVVVRGQGTVTIRPSASSNIAAFRVLADRVLIENFNLVANGGTRFFTGITLNSNIDDVSIQNVTIGTNTATGATSTAGMKFKSSGQRICVRNTTVYHAGGTDQNGYAIEQDGGSGSIAFRLANAYSNSEDGFSIENPSTLASANFLRCESTGNDGDGFDVNGGLIEVLCSEASANSNSSDAQGRGIVVSNAATQLHIENSHISDNEGNGINGGATDLRVISSTVVDNDAGVMGEQIVGSNVSVFTTIGRGMDFVYGDNTPSCGTSPVWAGNLCKSTSGTSCCAGSNPCCAEADIVFDGGNRTYLAVGSPGLDSSNGNPTSFTSSVRIAHSVDYFGTTRPQDGDGIGSPLRDVGAFERTPAPPGPTATRTPFPSFTKTPRHTDTPTRTRTRTTRPSRTPVPPTPTPPPCHGSECPTPCVGDCDCSGAVFVNELVFGVTHLFERATTPCVICFDGNSNGVVSVDELVLSVKHSISGCPGTGGGGGQGDNGLTVTVDVGEASGLPGATINLPISVSGGWGFITGVQVDLLYDSDVVDAYFDCVVSSRLQGGQSIAAELLTSPPGMRRLRVAVLPSFSSITGFTDGEVAVCTFDITSWAGAGAATTVHASVTGASDTAGTPYMTVGDPGSITVCGGCGCP